MDGDANLERLAEDWASLGPACLRSLPGAFAFAIWDKLEQVLWLARDPVGTRPIYYAHRQQRIAFSSALRPLLGLPWVSREIAADYLAEYLSFRYTHAPRTLLRDVSAVPPGHASASGRPARDRALVVMVRVAAERPVPEFPSSSIGSTRPFVARSSGASEPTCRSEFCSPEVSTLPPSFTTPLRSWVARRRPTP